ncbi:MAG TPA: sulfatase-like hydrolase/transferase [Myxococcota bacterium]|nr:sulfatase-like hydrolase/transferase [Myxococcota bacterium]
MTIDTLRADRVGCYGDAHARTPVMDTLAEQGVRFDVAISPAPLTLPSHASLLTALDPPRHAVRHNSTHRLPEGVPTLASALREAGFATAAFVGSVVLAERYGLARGFDVYDDVQMERTSSQTSGYAERPANRVVDAAEKWLATAPPRFFLWVHFYDPHAAYTPPAGWSAAFANDPYRGEIAFADFQLGRLLELVRTRGSSVSLARGGDASLFVAVTSDHGEGLGEHGERRHSYGVYDTTQRVPLILAGPGMPRGQVVRAPVRLVDVPPTLLVAAGLPAWQDADGRPLQPLVAGDETSSRDAYVETFATHFDYGWSALQGLRNDRYKYIRAPRPELYDVARDPGEREDLAAKLPAVARELDAKLAQRLTAPSPAVETVTLDAKERELLGALGYVAPEATPELLAADPFSGPDPKDEIGLLARVAEAERASLLGHADAALDSLRDLADPAPAVAALRATLALKAGEPALAERDARSAIRREPRRADLRLVLASALEAQGDAASARAAYEEAARIEPQNRAAWQGIERTSLLGGDADAAARARANADALAQPTAAPALAQPTAAP